MLVKDLEIKHPEWSHKHDAWLRLDLMLKSGTEILRHPGLFLAKRPMEGADVYASRCARFTYQDVLSTALGWYGSRLFGDGAPTFSFTEADSKVEQTDLLADFLEDCDGMGNSLLGEAQSAWFPRAVAFGHMYVYLDRSRVAPDAQSRLEQEVAGVFEPYTATFDPLAATNWSTDDEGNLNWIIFTTERIQSELGKPPVKIKRWFYVDRVEFRIFEAPSEVVTSAAAAQGSDDIAAVVVAEGAHALAALRIVPVLKLVIPPQLAFGDRVYPLVMDHVNALNEWKWLHMQCCLAVPVITGGETMVSEGDSRAPSQYSEVNLIELPKGGTFGWSEPGGVALKESGERVSGLLEEIYRCMYLLAHARTVRSTPSAQSGVSKSEDARASVEVLDGFGKVFRKFFRSLLTLAAYIADKPKTNVVIRGMEFAEPDELGEIETAQAVLDMNIPSDTFRKFVYKSVAKLSLDDEPEDFKKKVFAEIDAAPTQAEQRAQIFADQTTIFKGTGPVPPAPPSPPE